MDCSILGFPVHHQLPELAQTYVQSSKWCHPTILYSVIPFSSHLQSFPTSGSLPVSQFFTTGGQSTGASASASIFPMNTQDWSPLGRTGWISWQSNTLLQHHSSKASILQRSASFLVQLSHPYMTTGNTIALTRLTFVAKVMSLLFNMLSMLVITCLPRNKCLFISWLQSASTVILEPPQNKVCHCFPIYILWSDGTRCHDLSFLNVEF